MHAITVIRPYQPADRRAVRAICCETADRGDPIEGMFSDRELVADLVTRYYTDIEPKSCWVAEEDGAVVGYVNGALSTRRYARLMAFRVAPAAIIRAIGRGALLRAETWRALLAASRSRRGSRTRFGAIAAAFPAHLHIDIVKPARGRGVGRRLIGAFLAHVASHGVPGVHATVREDHPAGRHFFERMGFHEAGSYRVVLPAKRGTHQTGVIIYARAILPGARDPA